MTGTIIATDDFWEATSLNDHVIVDWVARLTAYRHDATPHDLPVGASAPIALRPVTDRTQRLLARRRSERLFGSRPLDHRDLERLLASVGPVGDGRRAVPEAGGLDTVHVFGCSRLVEGPTSGRWFRYDHRRHAVADIAPASPDDSLRSMFSLDDAADLPQLILAFVIDPVAVTAKYGARGNRFALQQVGHACQNVALRLAADRMRGVPLGGGHDATVLGVLGLAHLPVRYGGAIACGR